jgi:hypothetical protein
MLTPDTILQIRYRVVRQLGQGGMGAVYEAIDERLDTTVALKETFFSDERLRKQFEREARLLARLHHPALPRVSDHFSEGDGQFLVMQYIGGDDFAEMLNRRRGPFPTDQVLTWADQLLDALDYLHTQEPQIIHRDIKPQNLKLTSRNQIILLDFGLAKGQVGEVSRVTTSASIFGFTPNYAPLEQIQGLGTDARSDIYSLGSTIYHLLTGIKPPDALTRAAAIVNGQPDPLQPAHEANVGVDSEVANVLQRAMSQNKEQRYRSAAEMRKALEGTDLAATVTSRSEAATVILPQPTASGAPATVPMSAPATVAKQNTVTAGETTVVRHDVPPRRVSPWAIAALVIGVLGIGFGGYYAYQRRQSPQNITSVEVAPQAPAAPTQTPVTETTPETSSQAVERKVAEEEKKAAVAEKEAAKSEKKANEKKSTAASKRNTEGDDDEEGHDKVVVPEPYIPSPDVPTPPRGRPRIKRYGGVVIREFPDGSQLITTPNGEQVFVRPDGKRVVLRRGGKGNRERQPQP